MANPFLFEEPVDYAEANAIPSNPFLFGADPPFLADPGVDNPFLASVSSAPGTNPFADYSWDEPTQNDSGLLTPPTITNINDPENDFIASSDDETCKQPIRPPPPRPSMPKETHDLILSVTGALKATSDTLLDRIPPTRAPSPTAFADLHSPSPTPDLFGGEDLLSMSQQPTRPPPPARPPSASPAPPPAAPVEVQQQQQQQQQDLNSMEFDLFGAPAPQPKSKDAILNLYSQPKVQPQKDLLSEDFGIPMEMPLITSDDIPSVIEEKPVEEEPPTSPVKVEPASEAPKETVQVVKVDTNVQPAMFSPSPPKMSTPSPPVVTPVATPAIVPTPPARPPAPAPPQRPAPPSRPAAPPPVRAPIPTPTPPVPEPVASNFDMPIVSAPESVPSIFGTTELQQEVVESEPVKQPSPVFEQPANMFSSEPAYASEPYSEPGHSIFGTGLPTVEESPIFGTGSRVDDVPQIFGVGPPQYDITPQNPRGLEGFGEQPTQPVADAFDAFAAKFEQADGGKGTSSDPFGDPFGNSAATGVSNGDAWGNDGAGTGAGGDLGFGGDDGFDAFLSMSQPPPPPQPTPNRFNRAESNESEEGGFSVFIKPREGEVYPPHPVSQAPALAPPPRPPAFDGTDPQFNPFDRNGQIPAFPLSDGFQLPALSETEPFEGGFKRTDSQETPPTPLFDEDVSQPLEDFPRIHYVGEGWEMQLRQPNKKKITGQRFWKKIFVKLVFQGDNPVLQLFNLKEDKDPFQELPLQACYSVSEISAQQYDQFGKIFTVKLQYIFYKERPGVRPGQVTKAERITNKLSQFAAYAIQGDYQGVKEFGSDLKKLGLPVEHAPQISQLLKLGCMSFDDLKQFSVTIEECLFRMPVHRDRALNYKMEEVQITVVDEMYVEQDAYGHVEKQIARVRLFFLAFLSGMPDVELGMNDLWRQGKEVVGRHDIVPVVTEEWIRLESVEFHNCVQLDEYEQSRTIKFKPPDACYIELMRFRIRPPKNRELPLQLKAVMCVTGNRVELRADVLVPGFTSRKLGQIPCEDVMIRFPIPECWIYLFRVEKHFRYGSVKSAHRRTGKIKGIERFLGAVENMEPSLMEVTSGQAKYEHQHRAIVWRMPRLPKEGQGAYTTHNLVCRMQLTSFDQIPDNLADYAYVEFTMPATTASHTTVRSVSLVDSPSDNPPEKYVRQLARLEYRVGIEHTQGEEVASYVAATQVKPKAQPQETAPAPLPAPPPDSDSDSSG